MFCGWVVVVGMEIASDLKPSYCNLFERKEWSQKRIDIRKNVSDVKRTQDKECDQGLGRTESHKKNDLKEGKGGCP